MLLYLLNLEKPKTFQIAKRARQAPYFVSVFYLLIVTYSANAQSTECLTDIVGKSLTWQARWSSDGNDDGIIYKIIRSTELKKGEIIMLELAGPKSSRQKIRDLLIKDRLMIDSVCKKIDSGALNKRFTSEDEFTNNGNTEIEQSDLMKLPYIKYGKYGWQKADAPMNENLSTCSLLGKYFACTKTDKNAYIEQLKEIESEVKLMDELGY